MKTPLAPAFFCLTGCEFKYKVRLNKEPRILEPMKNQLRNVRRNRKPDDKLIVAVSGFYLQMVSDYFVGREFKCLRTQDVAAMHIYTGWAPDSFMDVMPVAEELRTKHGLGYIAAKLFESAQNDPKFRYALIPISFKEEVRALRQKASRENQDLVLIYLCNERPGESPPSDYAEFLEGFDFIVNVHFGTDETFRQLDSIIHQFKHP
jgi:hypothetical protein